MQPAPSTTSAPAGGPTSPAGPTRSTRPPRTTTVRAGAGEPPEPSNTAAPTIARERNGGLGSAPLGRQAEAERGQHDAGDRLDRPADDRAPQHDADLRDRDRIGAQPRQRDRAVDQAEREQPQERRPPRGNELDRKSTRLNSS